MSCANTAVVSTWNHMKITITFFYDILSINAFPLNLKDLNESIVKSLIFNKHIIYN